MRSLNRSTRKSSIRGTKVPGRKDSVNKTQKVIKRYHKATYLNIMSEPEKEANIKVLQNMNKRLNYLKNPRYKENKPPILMSAVSLIYVRTPLAK